MYKNVEFNLKDGKISVDKSIFHDIKEKSIFNQLKLYSEESDDNKLNNNVVFKMFLFERKFVLNIFFNKETNKIKSFYAVLIDGKSYFKDWGNADYKYMVDDYNDLLNIFRVKIGRIPDESYECYADYHFDWGIVRINCNRRDFLVGLSIYISD